jgi:hypothetical protein
VVRTSKRTRFYSDPDTDDLYIRTVYTYCTMYTYVYVRMHVDYTYIYVCTRRVYERIYEALLRGLRGA